MDNDINEAYTFSTVSAEPVQPFVLHFGGSPAATSRLCTVTNLDKRSSRQENCQNDDPSINLDTIALPQDQDIMSLMHKRQLMLQQMDPHMDDTSSAFSSGTSMANLEKKAAVIESGKDTPKSGAASPSRLVYQQKNSSADNIANNHLGLAKDVLANQQKRQCTDPSSLSASTDMLTQKSHNGFYEENSALNRFEEKMTDTSSTYDEYDDYEGLENHEPRSSS